MYYTNYAKAAEIAKTKVNHTEFISEFFEDVFMDMTDYETQKSSGWDIDTWVSFIVDYVDYRVSNIGVDRATVLEHNMTYIQLYNSYFEE